MTHSIIKVKVSKRVRLAHANCSTNGHERSWKIFHTFNNQLQLNISSRNTDFELRA